MRPSERRRRLRVVTSYVYEVGVHFDGVLAFRVIARAVEAARGDEDPAEDEALIIGGLGGVQCKLKFGKRYAAQIAGAGQAGQKIGITVGRRAATT